MKHYLILLTLSLSGCIYQEASSVDIEKAISFCSSKGGIDNLTILVSGDEIVICKNTERTNLARYKLE